MSAHATELRFEKDILVVSWDEADGLFRLTDDAEHKTLFGEPLHGRLASAWTFSAESGMFRSNALVEGHYWLMDHATRKPIVWIGEVHGLGHVNGLAAAGNLSICGKRSATDGSSKTRTHRGHGFQGAYRYYLVAGPRDGAQSNRWFLIVDGSGSCPIRKDLHADFLALQFVLGTAFYVDVLHGLDEDGVVVARAGGRLGRDQSHRPKTEPVVPVDFVREHWPSRFFEAISSAYREYPELRLYIVLSFYLDGLASFHVEGRYLALHVALEAFAYWLLRARGTEEPDLVNDRDCTGSRDRQRTGRLPSRKRRQWQRETAHHVSCFAEPARHAHLAEKVGQDASAAAEM